MRLPYSSSMARWSWSTAFLLWQGWVREVRMGKRIVKLEDEQRNVLMPLVERCADVIAQNTLMMERLEKALDR